SNCYYSNPRYSIIEWIHSVENDRRLKGLPENFFKRMIFTLLIQGKAASILQRNPDINEQLSLPQIYSRLYQIFPEYKTLTQRLQQFRSARQHLKESYTVYLQRLLFMFQLIKLHQQYGTPMELRIHDVSSFTGTDSEFIRTYMSTVLSNALRDQILEKFMQIQTIPQLQAFVQDYQSKEIFKESLK